MKQLTLYLLTFCLALAGALWTNVTAQTIRYVRVGGYGTRDGLSWDNASGDLQEMINASTAGDEIWVVAGTYKPNRPANDLTTIATNNRDNAFVLKAGVKLYGGFDPFFSPDVPYLPDFGSTGRNSETILSGDIGTVNVNSDNCYHVVIGVNIPAGSNTLIDGFTISDGNAGGIGGTGFITVNGESVYRYDGGGIHHTTASPTLTHVTVIENRAESEGGGMYNYTSSPVLTNVTISGNSAYLGAGICNDASSSPALTNVTISGNSAGNNGGGMYHNASSSPTLTNVTISGNRAANNGGGIWNASSSPNIRNSIIWGNSAGNDNNVYNNTPVYDHSLVEGVTGSGIISGADPLFVNHVLASVVPTTAGDYRLQEGSPAINEGDNSLYLTARGKSDFTGETDLTGNPRLSANSIDLGAYEYQIPISIIPDVNGIVYVDVTKNGSGSSWADAYPNLADPLLHAAKQKSGAITFAPSEAITAIYVAEGTYYPMYRADNYHFTNKVFPETDGRRDNAFVLVAGIKIYGGFQPSLSPAVTPVPDFGSTGRNGVTTLSGDIGTPNDNTDNCHHVVIGIDIPASSNTLIDGFTITGGNADGSWYITVNDVAVREDSGGGMYNRNFSSPTIVNVTIGENSASFFGGGMYNDNYSSPALVNVTIRDNSVDGDGGGICNDNHSSPTLSHVTISGNSATYYGGGMYNYYSSSVLTHVTISGNSADNGGGMYNMYADLAQLVNVLLSGNHATNDGGGIYNSHSTLDLFNVTMSGNSAGGNGGGIYNLSTSSIFNSIIWGNTAPTDGNLYNNSASFFVSNSLIDTPEDPFVDSVTGNYRLKTGSPAIDAGDNFTYLGVRGISTFTGEIDLDGNTRFCNGTIDMGAYEYQVPPAIRYVKAGGAGTGDGSSWADASGDLQAMINASIPGDEVWVAAGTYKPVYTADGYDELAAFYPTTSGGSDNAFVLKSYIKIFGGFSAGADDNANAPHASLSKEDARYTRNWNANPTILSGDNCYHIVIAVANDEYLLDGFTITGGKANGSSYITVNGTSFNCNTGGGMINISTSPIITNVIINGNSAENGGGMYNYYASPVLTNVLISGNSATVNGGGIYNHNMSSPVLTNVTISGNSATESGGGMYNIAPSASSPNIRNSIIWGNIAYYSGANVYWGSPVISYSLVGGIGTSGTNLDTDPLFADWKDPASTTMPNTLGDYRLQPGSPAIGSGNNTLISSGLTTDLDGNPRIVDSNVDMGAYEYQVLTAIRYVKQGGSGSGDGSSWADASGDLQEMINASTAGDEIWVAAGTYHPNRPANNLSTIDAANRNNAFVLKAGVSLLGGFPASGSPTLTDRDWNAFPAILSGDIGTANDNTDNCYHVVIGVHIPAGSNTLIDGFTITGGNANGSGSFLINGETIISTSGSGMLNISSSPMLVNVTISGNSANTGGGGMSNTISSSPTLTNVAISGNSANASGGGIQNSSSSPILTNVTVSGNSANNDGGGMYNASSSPILTNVTMNGNSASSGGAMSNQSNSSPALTHVTISGNNVTIFGGGMYNDSSSPTLTNVTISGNRATNDGGGMYNNHNSSPMLTNVTIGGNRANIDGGGMYNINNSSPNIRNSIIWGNRAMNDDNVHNSTGVSPSFPVYTSSLLEGATPGGGIISNADPQFVAPELASSAPTTLGDYRLQAGSPAVDVGDNALYLTARGIADFTGETDLAGNPRLVGSAIDLGAYENQVLTAIRYVKQGGSGSGDGSSWADASGDLQEMINISAAGDEIRVAAGTYKPIRPADNLSTIDPNNRDNAFVLKDGVSLLGGFPATGTPTLIDRDWNAFPTILSGDIGTANDITDNCYHVVIGVNIPASSNTLMDGFTITGGNANVSNSISVNGGFIGSNHGGGIYNRNSSPALTNVTISGNSANNDGGGIYNNLSSSPTLTNVTISENCAGGWGGGIYNSGSSSVLTNVIISGNSAYNDGGGMFNSSSSSPTLTNVTISGNSANNDGGGMFNIGSSSPTLTNVTISGNSANNDGGGISNNSYSSPTLTNVTISGNSANNNGGGMYNNSSSSPNIQNSIIWGNTATTGNSVHYDDGSSIPVYAHSLVEDVMASGIISGDNPQFVSPELASSAPTTLGDYRLQAGSPAVDVGDNALYLTARSIADFTGETDLAGNPRLVGGTIDLGAYETSPLPVITISTQPAPTTTLTEGSISGSLTVVASITESATLSYRWYENTTNSNTGGTVIAGETAAGFTIPTTLTAATYYYYCVVSASGGATDMASDVAVVTVNAPAPVYTVGFSVTGGNGTLEVTVDALPIATGVSVAAGKNVIFTAVPATGYRVKGWTDNAVTVNGTNATYTITALAAAHTVTVEFEAIPTPVITTPPRITGPASMTLTAGYTATSTDTFTITGDSPLNVTTNTNHGGKISWNPTTRCLDITEGLPVGDYPVVLTATNNAGTARITFTLTVANPVYYIDIPTNVEGGSIEVITHTPYLAEEGETVTIIVTPDEGYELESITIYDYNNSAVTIPLNCSGYTCTFTMPAHHISIVVVFRPVTTGIVGAGHALPLRAWTVNGVLYVSGIADGAMLRVYNIFGVLLYQGLAQEGKAEVALPGHGIYIIADGKAVVKVNN